MPSVARTTPADHRPLSDGFWEQALGISLWMIIVACCGLTYIQPVLPEHLATGWYVIPQQFGYVVAYFACAAFEWARGPISIRRFAYGIAIAFVGAFLSILACTGVMQNVVLLALGGTCMGVGQTLGYMAWIRMTAERPMREILYLTFLASIVSVVSTAAFTFAPVAPRLIILVVVLLPSSLALLVHYDRAVYSKITSKTRLKSGVATHGAMRDVWAALASSIVCCMALVLIAPIVSTAYVDVYSQETFRTLLAQGANLFALVCLAFVYFGLRKQPRIVDVYMTLMPVLATLVLVSVFVSPEQRWFVLFAGDACYCVVSLLLMFTVCRTSQQLDVSPVITYGILGGFVYLARVPEALLAVYPASPFDELAPLAITAVLLYLLVIPAFAVPALRRRWHSAAVTADESQNNGMVATVGSSIQEQLIQQACLSLANKANIPVHQQKVLVCLATGDSVKRIADELGLSEGTVRTYRKGIYAALGIHSMQELVDIVRERVRQLEADYQ